MFSEEGIEKYYTTVGSRSVAGGMSLNTKAENLGQLNIVMELETRFALSFSTEQVLDMRSVPQIVEIIKDHLDGS